VSIHEEFGFTQYHSSRSFSTGSLAVSEERGEAARPSGGGWVSLTKERMGSPGRMASSRVIQDLGCPEKKVDEETSAVLHCLTL
jgi:hypothetical protein